MTELRIDERRLVTILFSDLADSTGLTSRLEPEQFAELLEEIRIILIRAISAHGGELIRVDGDGLIAIFGYPDVYEDAGRRATEAALDIHAELAALEPQEESARPLQLHSGVHAGMVLLRSGDVIRGKYEILGDATNTAARLCDAAAPGEILVSAESLGADHHFFETAGCFERHLRGRRRPISVWTVTGRAPVVRTRFEARTAEGLTPFRGRTRESTALRNWLGGASPRLAIHGPAGIGKSRFLREETANATRQGWRVAGGWCESYLSAQPLQPFRQILSALEVEGDPAATGVEGALAAFGEACRRNLRLLLTIDDWQWADDASVDLLTRLTHEGILGRYVKLITASRLEGDGSGMRLALDTLALPPLAPQDVRATIDGLLGPADSFVAARIEGAAGGSPLLIEELCHGFRAGALSVADDLRSAWFDQTVQSRFSGLDPEEREILRLLSVVGHVAPNWLVNTLLGADIPKETQGRLREADFLFSGEREENLRFKHGLTRDAIYSSIGPADRRALHSRVLRALDHRPKELPREQVLDAMAHHAVESGSDRGMPLAIDAGDAALAAGALDRAQAHYAAGLRLVRTRVAKEAQRDWAWAFLNKFGLACVLDPSPDQLGVLDVAQAILEAQGIKRDRMRAIYWRGATAYGLGRARQAVRDFKQAHDIAKDHGSPNDLRTIRAKMAHALFASARIGESREALETLIPELTPSDQIPDRGLSAYSHACLAFLNSECGDFQRAETLFDQADAILADPDDPVNASLLLYRSAASVSQGEWERAIQITDAILTVSQRSRTRMQHRTCRAQAAFSGWRMTQDPSFASDLLMSARVFLDQANSQQYASMVFGWVVELAADRGEPDLAREFMGAVLHRARDAGDRLGEAMGWRAMARLSQMEGEPDRADRFLGHARRSASLRLSRREAAHNLVCEAALMEARGNQTTAGRLMQQAAAEFAVMRMPSYARLASEPTSR